MLLKKEWVCEWVDVEFVSVCVRVRVSEWVSGWMWSVCIRVCEWLDVACECMWSVCGWTVRVYVCVKRPCMLLHASHMAYRHGPPPGCKITSTEVPAPEQLTCWGDKTREAYFYKLQS